MANMTQEQRLREIKHNIEFARAGAERVLQILDKDENDVDLAIRVTHSVSKYLKRANEIIKEYEKNAS